MRYRDDGHRRAAPGALMVYGLAQQHRQIEGTGMLWQFGQRNAQALDRGRLCPPRRPIVGALEQPGQGLEGVMAVQFNQ
ncbi:hypothetical protein [Mesorhizobium sp. M5C.F.Ca.IN.020.29.1.1]|uniref:hypothetical protein n=1 Tax=Mesorhizobium sp. M5C.F.Ca.IN.020.29.1.1 TaxID=2496770 RepID=UPI0013DFEA1D|nr:hypothetical protein [Mesorhizobium sp. M5C.F.Ca.IN.020.29.1.1]